MYAVPRGCMKLKLTHWCRYEATAQRWVCKLCCWYCNRKGNNINLKWSIGRPCAPLPRRGLHLRPAHVAIRDVNTRLASFMQSNFRSNFPSNLVQTILLCLYRLTQLKECITFNSIYWFHNMFRQFFGHHQVNTIVYQMLFWIATILLLIWAHIYNNCSGGWQ
jgi:hypothetical protein